LATFSAGLFAVHPVVVEPVAWLGGREELLMTLGALGCLHFHLSARRAAEAGGADGAAMAYRAAAVACCAAACLSNAVGAVIPLLITTWDVLMPPRDRRRGHWWDTIPLWLIGAATILIKGAGPFGPSRRNTGRGSGGDAAAARSVSARIRSERFSPSDYCSC